MTAKVHTFKVGDVIATWFDTGAFGAKLLFGVVIPKIVLDDGQVVWGAECWWGPESTYATFRGERAEKRCSIVAERETLP